MSDFFLSNLNNSIVQSVFLTALTLRKSVEIKLNFSAFLTNLLKAFGGLSHGLLIIKFMWVWFGSMKISARLSVKSQAKD